MYLKFSRRSEGNPKYNCTFLDNNTKIYRESGQIAPNGGLHQPAKEEQALPTIMAIAYCSASFFTHMHTHAQTSNLTAFEVQRASIKLASHPLPSCYC